MSENNLDSEHTNSSVFTKTQAKKSLLINFESNEQKKILKEIKKSFSNASLKELDKTESDESKQSKYVAIFSNYKEAKEAKETLKKLLAKFKQVSVESAFVQKKKEIKSNKKHDNNQEKQISLNGHFGERSRNLFEIRFPKLIIRNLNFNIKEENFKTEMEKFGQIKLIHLPKKETGKYCGYGFVTYERMEDAVKAMNELNARADKFMGTKVAVDWCLPKNIFLKNINESKTEENEKKENSDEENDNESDDESEKEDEESKSKKRKSTDEQPNDKFVKKRKSGTSDVQEHRTVFIRNLSFDASEEAISEAFSKFGAVKLVKICMDKELERPKGTAFIQFEDSQGAINACAESGMFEMDSRVLQIDMAVSRDKATDLVEEKKLAPTKDNRNLALAKEGVIYSNSYEAKEVTKADMIRRQKLEQEKAEKLKNLHFFVSPTRLSVHNIPLKCSDQELKEVFLKALGCDENKLARKELVECKIMRDLARVNSEGVYRSKGFGFVGFKTHEAALKALHATNNVEGFLPNGTKLIVQFSVEDMRALKKKEQRLAKSKNANKLADSKIREPKKHFKTKGNMKPNKSKKITKSNNKSKKFKK